MAIDRGLGNGRAPRANLERPAGRRNGPHSWHGLCHIVSENLQYSEAAVALRTFTDEKGRNWRAWDVVPDAPTALVGEQYRHGWLCFELEDGSHRRRITSYPENWATIPVEQLVLLCGVATLVDAQTGAPKGPSTGTSERASR